MIRQMYLQFLRGIVYALAVVSGLSVVVMMSVTCLEIILRVFNQSMGAYDIVKLAGAVSFGCALPYTTAVKGHVAIEYFFHKMNKTWRTVVDTITRFIAMFLFGTLAWRSVSHGFYLYNNAEVTLSLQIPTFWVLYVIAFSCAVVVLVIFEHVLRPGKELIKP
jgi:TRAP-type C4-dicarboxylate transport system permease small subunit